MLAPLSITEGIAPSRLLLDHGPRVLSDAELVEALTAGAAGRGVPAREGEALLAAAGGLERLARSHPCDLAALPGVGPDLAVRLGAALELGRRAVLTHRSLAMPIRGPVDLLPAIRAEVVTEDREVLVAVLLDRRHRVLGMRRVSDGTVSATAASPRDIFSY